MDLASGVNLYLNSFQKTALCSLSNQTLKTRIEGLIQTKNPANILIVQLVLDIITKTKVNYSKDLLLMGLLREPNYEIIKKVSEIVQKGVFEDFICNVGHKKKEAITFQQAVEIVNLYTAVLSKKTLNTTSVANDSNTLSALTLDSFQKIQETRYYYQLPKLAEEYRKYLNLSLKNPLNCFGESFEFLFEKLNSSKHFVEYEKIEIAKIIFRLINDQKTIPYTQTDLREFLNQASLIKKNAGEEVLDYFFMSVKLSQEISIDEILKALQLLNLSCQNEKFYEVFGQWQSNSLSKLFELLEGYLVKIGIDDALFQEDINARLSRFANDPTVTNPLDQADIELIGAQYQKVNAFCFQYQHNSFPQLINKAHVIRAKAKEGPLTEDQRMELIAIGRLAIRLSFGIYPYSTQILALLGVLIGGESRQAQVKTGEGKSTIVALWAFVQAMECRAVDIITSSRYLSKRDQKKFSSFFEGCGISTSHICYDDIKPGHFKAQILYGPAFDFEFAWMGDHLWDSNLFAERLKVPFVSRNFDAVCIDESDNLLIDTAANGARLSFPAEVTYEWVYAPILLFVKLQIEQGSSEASLKNWVTPLRIYICQKIKPDQQKLFLQIPDEQLEKWLSSACTALLKRKEKKHYVIKDVIDEYDNDISKRKIQIVDSGTSRISENSRWSEGTHEFIEVKHDITVEKESLNPISLSHSVFYKFYKTITALTGTAEYVQTAKIYRIITFHVPPHLPNIRKDLPPVFTKNKVEHLAAILETARDIIRARRPLLIVCATIKNTLKLAKMMQENNIPCELLNEIQSATEDVVVERAGTPGKITIATTVAGRGTDIVLNPESLSNGGLHVLLTFYPDSEREEQQVLGRAGRQGQPGTSQMILNRQDPKIKKTLPFDFPIEKIELGPEMAVKLLFQRYEKNLLTQQQMAQHLLASMGIDERAFLNQHRKDIEEIQNIICLKRANLERFFATKTHLFFAEFREWFAKVNDENFLDTWSQKFCSKGITKVKSELLDFSHIKKDKALAEEFKLLLSVKHNELSWKIFFKSVVTGLKQQVINAWALDFFQPIENLIRSLDKSEDEIQELIEERLTYYQSKWGKYLNHNGYGIFIYLKELTTLDFVPKG